MLVHATPERVYDALTTAQVLDSRFTTSAQVSARRGGVIHFRWPDWGPDRVTAEDSGPVLEAVRLTRFVFQRRPDHPSYIATVEIDLEAVRDGTVVRLRETGCHDTPDGRRAMLNCAAGWGEILCRAQHPILSGGPLFAKLPCAFLPRIPTRRCVFACCATCSAGHRTTRRWRRHGAIWRPAAT